MSGKLSDRFKFQAPSAAKMQERSTMSGGAFDRMLKDGVINFSPKSGNHRIRIFPRLEPGADHYGLDVFVHYGVGPDNGQYLCPLKAGVGACPVCEEVSRLDRQGDKEAGKKLSVKRRVLYMLYDRNAKEQIGELRAWLAPQTFDKDLAKVCRDPDSGAIIPMVDLDAGYDTYFTIEGVAPNVKYTGYQLSRNPSPICDDPATAEKHLLWIQANPMQSLLQFMPYERIKLVLEGQATTAGDKKPEAVQTRTEATGPKPMPKPALEVPAQTPQVQPTIAPQAPNSSPPFVPTPKPTVVITQPTAPTTAPAPAGGGLAGLRARIAAGTSAAQGG